MVQPVSRWKVPAWGTVCLALLLGGAAGAAEADCPRGRSAYERHQGQLPFARFTDPRIEATVCYPSTVFRKVDEHADGFRFLSDDGLAWFQLSHRANVGHRSIEALMDEAERGLKERGATVTYRRKKADWFVLTGHIGDRIYYRKTILTGSGRGIDTLLIDIPQEQKPFYYDIVERMSWSYGPRQEP